MRFPRSDGAYRICRAVLDRDAVTISVARSGLLDSGHELSWGSSGTGTSSWGRGCRGVVGGSSRDAGGVRSKSNGLVGGFAVFQDGVVCSAGQLDGGVCAAGGESFDSEEQ